MILEYFDEEGRPKRVKAVRLVIRNQNNDPNLVAVDAPGAIVFSDVRDPVEFHRMLRDMGIAQTIVLHELDHKPVRQISFE